MCALIYYGCKYVWMMSKYGKYSAPTGAPAPHSTPLVSRYLFYMSALMIFCLHLPFLSCSLDITTHAHSTPRQL